MSLPTTQRDYCSPTATFTFCLYCIPISTAWLPFLDCLGHEDAGCRFPQNVSNSLPLSTMSYIRRLDNSLDCKFSCLAKQHFGLQKNNTNRWKHFSFHISLLIVLYNFFFRCFCKVLVKSDCYLCSVCLSVRPSVCSSTWNGTTPTSVILVKFRV